MKLLPAAAAAATGIQVGSAMVATRIVVDQAGPASLALLRYAIGFCCLLPFVLVAAPRVRFARRDLLPIGLLGIAQFGLLIALSIGILITVVSAWLPAARAMRRVKLRSRMKCCPRLFFAARPCRPMTSRSGGKLR